MAGIPADREPSFVHLRFVVVCLLGSIPDFGRFYGSHGGCFGGSPCSPKTSLIAHAKTSSPTDGLDAFRPVKDTMSFRRENEYRTSFGETNGRPRLGRFLPCGDPLTPTPPGRELPRLGRLGWRTGSRFPQRQRRKPGCPCARVLTGSRVGTSGVQRLESFLRLSGHPASPP